MQMVKDLSWAGVALRVYVILVYLFLLAPLLVVVLLSFSESISVITLDSLSVQWYRQLLQDSEALSALGFSILVGVSSSALAVVIGTTAAFGLVRHKFRGKALLQAALFSPMLVPEIITGVALLSFFVFLRIPRGYLTVTIGHTLLLLPYVVSIISARLYGFDRSLEEAALNLGASRPRVLAEVTLPLMIPAIIGAAIIAFIVSFDNVIGSMFWTSASNQTLPTVVFAKIRFEMSPDINAIGTVMIVITLSLFSIYQLLNIRRRSSRAGFPGAP